MSDLARRAPELHASIKSLHATIQSLTEALKALQKHADENCGCQIGEHTIENRAALSTTEDRGA